MKLESEDAFCCYDACVQAVCMGIDEAIVAESEYAEQLREWWRATCPVHDPKCKQTSAVQGRVGT